MTLRLNGPLVITANGARGGDITALAKGGTLLADGRIEATGSDSSGGSIRLLGERVGLVGHATVNVSGRTGGGTVLAGGDYQGKSPAVQNAEATYVGPDSGIRADAIEAGNGGKVIIWADGATRVSGSVSARGGVTSGNGGFVEVSGKDWLEFTGLVNTTAPFGQVGTVLFDPTNITLSAGATTNGTCPAGGPCFSLTGNPATAVLNVTDLLNALANNNVTVNTASTAANAGNITVANAIGYGGAAARTLTLTANNNIAFSAGANITSTSSALNLTLNAAGAITTLRDVSLNGGTLTFNATGNAAQQAGTTIQGNTSVVKQGAGTLTLSTGNTYTGATDIQAGTVTVSNASGLGTTAGATTVNAGATLALSGNITVADPLVLNGGTLSRAANNPTASGTINLAADSTVTGAAGTLTLSGTVSGAGALSKTGAGTVVLSGNNTYTGAHRHPDRHRHSLERRRTWNLGRGRPRSMPGPRLPSAETSRSPSRWYLNGGTLSRAANNPTASGTIDLAADSTVTGAGGT